MKHYLAILILVASAVFSHCSQRPVPPPAPKPVVPAKKTVKPKPVPVKEIETIEERVINIETIVG